MSTDGKPSIEDGNLMSAEFQTIRANLQKRRLAILAKISEEPPLQGSDDITRGDSLDIASSARDREITFMLKSRELDELRAVEDAIERIERDDYGICASCEDPIELKRLEAIPWARFCRSCQEEMENRKTPGRMHFDVS
jgi:DnaK suppressor protein